MQNNNDHQPRLIAEPESEYTLIPEEQARKEEYRERLRQYLQDPEFRQIPGFPIGDDEAILELSDPPYYTACPNPFLTEIIEQWQKERVDIRKVLGLPDDSEDSANSYHREPFAADVSEGKNNPIYNAHSYHTKVPHPAIMRYILHYTDPGDIVFDGFCGTGMTGVAGHLCRDRNEVEKLGYHVDEEGWIYGKSGDTEPISRLGARKAVLNDLSPAATFISYNYNTSADVNSFEGEARRILKEVEAECDWMYETWHPHCDDPNRKKRRMNYLAWSLLFLCPECNTEISFWDIVVDKEKGKVRDDWNCPGCNALLSINPKRDSDAIKAERAWESYFDHSTGSIAIRQKRIPSFINYPNGRRSQIKNTDEFDIEIIRSISKLRHYHWVPTEKIPEGEKTDYLISNNITHYHHLFTDRNLVTLGLLWKRIKESGSPALAFCFTASLRACTLLASIKFNYFFHGGGGPITPGIKGTYYVTSIIPEIPPTKSFRSRISAVKRFFNASLAVKKEQSIITTQSSSHFNKIKDGVIDYIFVDPPFGHNIMYSELNYLWESWFELLTNSHPEAIVNKVQRKNLSQYQEIMENCFSEFYRLLKPGRLITVEFHNSQNRVWNSIQEAVLRSGFIIADVRTFDKKQGTFNQLNASGAVKSDLIISAYKPHTEFERAFQTKSGTEAGAWAFVRQHLEQLPVAVRINGDLEALSERQTYLLFDRMVAFHIQRGATVPLSASNFYAGLEERFSKRDGMYFLPEQVPDYDHARLEAKSVAQLTMFVSDEKTAIQWLRQQLDPELGGESQTYQDILPNFLRQLHQAKHEVLPELSDLLEQNFLQDEQGQWYVPDPNKASDLEKIRNKSLQQEFNQYLEGKKKLKQFRTEAVRAGFADAWQRKDFETIIKVAERLPETVLQEDPDLLMYYDNASLRVD